MQHAVKSSPMDVVEEYFWGKKLLSVCGGYRPGELLWVHSNGVIGKPAFHRRANLSWLSKICNCFGEIAAVSRKSLTLTKPKWRFFGKKDPLHFHKCFPSPTEHTETRLFVQISWNLADRKSLKSRVIYWTEKKQNFGSRSRCRFCADRAQNLSGTAPNNILGVPQISSKSVHFRRTYSRTREHRSNAPQSVCNTRRSLSFFAE